jgi:Rieske Fe-S protein
MIDHELMKSVAEQLMTGKTVTIQGKTIPIKHSSYQRLKMLEFEMKGKRYQAIEQNPEKPSRWGKLAQEGHKVVQFRDVESGKYVAVAVDGEVKEYGG